MIFLSQLEIRLIKSILLMLHLSEFLSRFKNFGLDERVSKEAILEEIDKLLPPGLVEKKDLSIKNRIAIVKASGPLKTEIILRKEEILKKCREKIGRRFLVDEIR